MKKEELQVEKQNFKYIKFATVAILAIFAVFSFLKGCEAEKKLVDIQALNKALGDSLKTWRDKEGNYVANITLLESEKTDLFTKLNTADSTVNKLQDLVKKYKKQLDKKGSATVITTDADIQISEPTIVYRDTSKPCDPIYKSNFEIKGTGKYEKTKWVWGTVNATKDTTSVNLKFHEEIDVVIGQEKTGFLGLGKPRSFAEVTLHNPYNKVSTLRSYSTKPLPAKKFGIGPTVAYGLGTGFTPQIFVGIGVNWSIIKL